MVTAIVIPIILFYFFWLTKKEMKAQELKWLEIENVRKESVLTGEIKNTTVEKQRFYHHRFIYVQEILLQTETKLITIKKRMPITKDTQLETFKPGEYIKVYGSWQGKEFYFKDYEVLNSINE